LPNKEVNLDGESTALPRASATSDESLAMVRTLMIAVQLTAATAFMAPAAVRPQLSNSKVVMGGKGFGGGEATRDPAPTVYDPNDPKGKQQAIHKAESFAEYLAKRGAGGGAAVAAGPYPNLPPSVKPGVLTGQAVIDLLEDAKKRGCVTQ
jgi:hypothetical protein